MKQLAALLLLVLPFTVHAEDQTQQVTHTCKAAIGTRCQEDFDNPVKPPCTQWCSPFFKSLPPEEYLFDFVTALDGWTTMDIKHHPNFHEQNPLLGEHPSDARIWGMILLGDALHAAITYELVDGGAPKPIIKAWEYVSIGIDAGFVAHNYSMGLRFKF